MEPEKGRGKAREEEEAMEQAPTEPLTGPMPMGGTGKSVTSRCVPVGDGDQQAPQTQPKAPVKEAEATQKKLNWIKCLYEVNPGERCGHKETSMEEFQEHIRKVHKKKLKGPWRSTMALDQVEARVHS